jgi:hypothetical protein
MTNQAKVLEFDARDIAGTALFSSGGQSDKYRRTESPAVSQEWEAFRPGQTIEDAHYSGPSSGKHKKSRRSVLLAHPTGFVNMASGVL